MKIVTIFLSIVLSVFSTAIMSYIAMATPIGPWIAPTIVLCALLFFKLLRYKSEASSSSTVFVTVAASVGGILATAFGFSFPTLYFLDQSLFNAWLAEPMFFCVTLGFLALCAGAFGIWIADIFEQKLIVQEELPFPIGELIYKMIDAHNQVKKSLELLIGFMSTAFFCFLQDGFYACKGIIPKSLVLLPAAHISFVSIPVIRFDLWPLLWSIGFVTGHVIAIPLLVGALSKICVVDPINTLFFPSILNSEFVLAFCSGMVLSGAILSFMEAPKLLVQGLKKIIAGDRKLASGVKILERNHMVELAGILSLIFCFLTYFGFSLVQQAYLVVCTFICTYQIAVIAGKIGLAQLGRFATFVMVPALFIFKLTSVQIVFIATFVEIAGGVAADVLFGRKVGILGNISLKKIKTYQYLGLLISACCIGIIFWLLIGHFGLGTPDLLAQRAQLRQLLINAQSFNAFVLIVGCGFGLLLKFIKLSPLLVLSGLLMPLNISFGLIVGGLMTYFFKKKEELYPFWSGVFAANSLWMLFKTIL